MILADLPPLPIDTTVHAVPNKSSLSNYQQAGLYFRIFYSVY